MNTFPVTISGVGLVSGARRFIVDDWCPRTLNLIGRPVWQSGATGSTEYIRADNVATVAPYERTAA